MAKKKKLKLSLLNWFPQSEFTKGLIKRFQGERWGKDFMTIWLGTKWGDKLGPGDLVRISISENDAVPNLIGTARVLSVTKTIMADVLNRKIKLHKNIGAKDPYQALEDMRSVYGETMVYDESVITVIRLEPFIPEPQAIKEVLQRQKSEKKVKKVLR